VPELARTLPTCAADSSAVAGAQALTLSIYCAGNDGSLKRVVEENATSSEGAARPHPSPIPEPCHPPSSPPVSPHCVLSLSYQLTVTTQASARSSHLPRTRKQMGRRTAPATMLSRRPTMPLVTACCNPGSTEASASRPQPTQVGCPSSFSQSGSIAWASFAKAVRLSLLCCTLNALSLCNRWREREGQAGHQSSREGAPAGEPDSPHRPRSARPPRPGQRP